MALDFPQFVTSLFYFESHQEDFILLGIRDFVHFPGSKRLPPCWREAQFFETEVRGLWEGLLEAFELLYDTLGWFSGFHLKIRGFYIFGSTNFRFFGENLMNFMFNIQLFGRQIYKKWQREHKHFVNFNSLLGFIEHLNMKSGFQCKADQSSIGFPRQLNFSLNCRNVESAFCFSENQPAD